MLKQQRHDRHQHVPADAAADGHPDGSADGPAVRYAHPGSDSRADKLAHGSAARMRIAWSPDGSQLAIPYANTVHVLERADAVASALLCTCPRESLIFLTRIDGTVQLSRSHTVRHRST